MRRAAPVGAAGTVTKTVGCRAIALGAAVLVATALACGALAPAALAHRAGVQAFLLTGAPDSFADLRAHARQVSVVYPTYYECSAGGGRIVGADVPAVDAFARAHRIALLPRFTCQEGAAVHRILTEPALRAVTLARLARLARARAFGGLCLDLENDGGEDREALTSFAAALARALHAQGKRLTVVVDGVSSEPPPTSSEAFYDDPALAAVADTVFVLAWGAHWEGSPPGPLAPLSYVAAVARYVSSLPSRSRFVIGAPMYGLDWEDGPASAAAGAGMNVGASAYQYSSIRALQRSVGAAAQRDPASGELTFAYTTAGATHRVWYMDARSVLDVLAIARASGLRLGLWRLGEEDQSLWSSPLLAGAHTARQAARRAR